MSSSREESPDWIRVFKETSATVLTLSSDSESSPENASEVSEPGPLQFENSTKEQATIFIDGDEEMKIDEASSVKSVKSKRHLPVKKIKTDTKADDCRVEMEAVEETLGRQNQNQVSATRLPLILPEKIQYAKALVECEGDSIDLSGDVGAVGRIIISDTESRNPDVFFDLKGAVYKTTIVPSRTFCVVNFGQSEAKIEAVMNDFIQLKQQSNIFEAETMVEGTLEGFSFDSEEEADKLPKPSTDQNEGSDEEKPTKPKVGRQKQSKVSSRGPKKSQRKGQGQKKGRARR